MIHQQQNISDTTVHKVGDKPFLHGLVSGNALSPLPCELIKRYYSLIKKNEHNPYYPSKREWQRDVFVKIKELSKLKK